MFQCFNFPLDIGVVVIRKRMLGSVYEYIIFIFIQLYNYFLYFIIIYFIVRRPPSAVRRPPSAVGIRRPHLHFTEPTCGKCDNSLRSWRDFARECFCFGCEDVNGSGKAVGGLVKSRGFAARVFLACFARDGICARPLSHPASYAG